MSFVGSKIEHNDILVHSSLYNIILPLEVTVILHIVGCAFANSQKHPRKCEKSMGLDFQHRRQVTLHNNPKANMQKRNFGGRIMTFVRH